jgi:hypothetical protein
LSQGTRDILAFMGRKPRRTVVSRNEKGEDVSLQVTFSLLIISVTIGAASPASAWWQFAANRPNGERQTSPHYGTLKECNWALKLTELRLAKKYPELYPLVGSCEEFR